MCAVAIGTGAAGEQQQCATKEAELEGRQRGHLDLGTCAGDGEFDEDRDRDQDGRGGEAVGGELAQRGVGDEVAEQQGRAVKDEADGGIGLHLADGLEPRNIDQPAAQDADPEQDGQNGQDAGYLDSGNEGLRPKTEARGRHIVCFLILTGAERLPWAKPLHRLRMWLQAWLARCWLESGLPACLPCYRHEQIRIE